MKAEVNLYSYAVFPDGEMVEVGRILSRNLRRPGKYEGFFKYSPMFLAHPKAYPIDPVHLPLKEKVFEAGNGEIGLHSVFEDSLPDAWGRRILARKGGLDQAHYAPAHLLGVLHGGGLGRFLFSEQQRPPSLSDGSIKFSEIAKAMEEAGQLEESIDTDNTELLHLLACGSSAGGARPKVLTEKDGKYWIAKFASRKDLHPALFVTLEEAGLTLAAKAGLDVPEFYPAKVGSRNLLLIRRFDLTPDKGRKAIISFKTLIGVEDQYAVSYSDLADVIRRFSFQPKHDLELLYRQMIVNILLVNTDDHLQNFAMLHTQKGWCLSPSYDIVPNIYQSEQILQINGKHGGIVATDVVAEGQRFGLSVQMGKSILHDVCDRMSGWEDIWEKCRVPEEHTGKIKDNIRQRIILMAK